ncbi:hypothetical protein AGMMS50293_26970 [Spirochaetia bacterium]|nr:hypothetical protein AGMMS50293_26970 [Spirochaetia bacterium]
MASNFGFLVKLDFLQDIASAFISSINGAIVCNLEKYVVISKAFWYTAMEDIQGDYLEFGVYTGSSFCHALRSHRKNLHYYPSNGGGIYPLLWV